MRGEILVAGGRHLTDSFAEKCTTPKCAAFRGILLGGICKTKKDTQKKQRKERISQKNKIAKRKTTMMSNECFLFNPLFPSFPSSGIAFPALSVLMTISPLTALSTYKGMIRFGLHLSGRDLYVIKEQKIRSPF